MLSLTNEQGTPVSTFGTGVAFSNSPAQVNPATFSNTSLFGSLGGNGSGGSGNAAAVTATRASSTAQLGYGDPLKARPGAQSTPMNPVAPPASPGGPQGTSSGQGGGGVKLALDSAIKHFGPQPDEAKPTPPPASPSANGRAIGEGLYNAASRVGTFAHAATSSRPGQQAPHVFSAQGVADDLAEDV